MKVLYHFSRSSVVLQSTETLSDCLHKILQNLHHFEESLLRPRTSGCAVKVLYYFSRSSNVLQIPCLSVRFAFILQFLVLQLSRFPVHCMLAVRFLRDCLLSLTLSRRATEVLYLLSRSSAVLQILTLLSHLLFETHNCTFFLRTAVSLDRAA